MRSELIGGNYCSVIIRIPRQGHQALGAQITRVYFDHVTGYGGYPYTDDLLALDRCIAPAATTAPALAQIATPLKVEAWTQSLRRHPDQRFANYIIAGLKEGFRIGADRGKIIRPAASNMPSAHVHRRVITDYINSERRLGRMLGPFPLGSFAHVPVQRNRIGVIPKTQAGKWRLITDLSYPPGSSVNGRYRPLLLLVGIHYGRRSGTTGDGPR